LYLFSDGITDQFGGEHKRKFSKKRLADLLAEVAHLPCQVQQQRIADALAQWQGNRPQLDDQLLIGIVHRP
jgi:serine phosphatase RsbU (regulator of sigma subunit)